MDGHHDVRVSQSYLANLEVGDTDGQITVQRVMHALLTWSLVLRLCDQVSQHENCQVKVTIATETASGEHKFKMIGLMISDSAGEGRCLWRCAIHACGGHVSLTCSISCLQASGTLIKWSRVLTTDSTLPMWNDSLREISTGRPMIDIVIEHCNLGHTR